MTGCLYQDEWGRSMQSNKEWNKYELNIPLLTKIDNALRLDEIEKRKSDF